MFTLHRVWDDVKGLKGKGLDDVMAWLAQQDDVDMDDVEVCKDAYGDVTVYVDGYWADYSPVIELEDGVVVRWYRSGAWE